MKPILESWRKYLTEEAIEDLSKSGLYLDNNFIVIYDYEPMSADIKRSVDEDPDEYDIKKYIKGIARLGYREKRFTVEEIWAEQGYGPTLYRIAIEQSGESGLSPSIIRGQVSDEASKVWENFYDGKGKEFVRHEPIENKIHNKPWLDSIYYATDKRVDKEKAIQNHQKIFSKEKDPYEELQTHLIESAAFKLTAEMEKLD